MKRRIGFILLTLFIGAIVNVLVAWGLTYWGSLNTWDTYILKGRGMITFPNETMVDRIEYPSYIPVEWSESDELILSVGFGMKWADYNLDSGGVRQNPTGWLRYFEAGWPLRSLYWARGSGPGHQQDVVVFINRWSISLNSQFEVNRISGGSATLNKRLPIYPRWSYFLLNTVFYAAIIWTCIRGTAWLQRKRRRQKGLCIRCAYDLNHVDHQACPECGLMLEPSGSQTAVTQQN